MGEGLEQIFPNGLRVLVVDHDPKFLEIVEIMLKSCQYKVTTCESPICALSILRERTEQFDLLLTDLHMSGMSGFELAKIVDKELRIPVILMSVKTEVDLVIKGIQQGACYFLQKPIKICFIKNLMTFVACKRISQNLETNISRRSIRKQNAPQIGNPMALNDQVGKEQCSKENIVRNEYVGSDRHSFNKNKRNQVKWHEENNSSKSKKHHINWTPHIQEKFSKDVTQLRTVEAVPNEIIKLMNAEGIERHHVPSLHQKSCIQFSQEKENQAPCHSWNQFNSTMNSLYQPRSTLMDSRSMSNASINQELIRPQPYQRALSLGVVANTATNMWGNTPRCGREVLGSSGGTAQPQQLCGYGQTFYNNNVLPNTLSGDPFGRNGEPMVSTMQNTSTEGTLPPPIFTVLKSNHDVAGGLTSSRAISTKDSQTINFGKECYGNQEVGSSSKAIEDDAFEKLLKDLLEGDDR